MQSFIKHTKKHLFLFIGTMLLIFIINICLCALMLHGVTTPSYWNVTPSEMVAQTAERLVFSGGAYSLSDTQKQLLSENDIWCMLIDIKGDVVWSFDLPDEIPLKYSLQDVALMSRGYLQDYPIFVWEHGENLLVAGYPKLSYTKILANYFPYDSVRILPIFIFALLFLDLFMLFVAYYLSKRSITKNITPIVNAISRLSYDKQTPLKTKGDLAAISDSLTKTATILEKNDKARANWISGVSHDIRTPLSMVLGYADRIAKNPDANDEIQNQAVIIRNQSMKMKRLIQDFNLVSKLEYDVQPISSQPFIPAKLLRGIVAEYLNNDLNEKYSIELDIVAPGSTLTVNGDIDLLKRAIENIIQNSINHNPQGCIIRVLLDTKNDGWSITITDNGKGVSRSELSDIQNKQHYLEASSDREDLRHGLGLLIVRQVTTAHNGAMKIESGEGEGFSVLLSFPLQ